MTRSFGRGDRVAWSFRGIRVVGRVVRRVTARTWVAGRIVAATPADPRFVVKSEKSGRETARRPTALRRVRGRA